MQRPIESAVTAAVEAVADRLPGGGGDRGAAGESCEGRFRADPAGVRPGKDELRGRERADAGLLEQLGRELPREPLDLACELALLGGQLQHPSGNRAQREQGAAQLGIVPSPFGSAGGQPPQQACLVSGRS